MLKNILYFIAIIFITELQAQEQQTKDNEKKNDKENKSFFEDIPYYADDFLITAGLNNGGLYFNKNNFETTYGYGSHFGVEHYQSLGMNLFANYGLHFNNTNFRQRSTDMDFSLYRLELPFFVSYEIPELRKFDFRFLLGGQFSYLLNATRSRDYTQEEITGDNTIFIYDPSGFRRFDMGLFFGLSMEIDNYYFRIGSTINVNKLDPNEQGMIHSLHLTVGVFPFRYLRK